MYRDKAVALIECNDTAFVMFKQGVASAVRDRPTVYLSEFSNGVGGKPAVSISNLSMDVSGPDHSWDNNSMFLVQPGHNGKGVIRMSDTLTTLRNILGNAGIITVTE
jgi:hypothetical protein